MTDFSRHTEDFKCVSSHFVFIVRDALPRFSQLLSALPLAEVLPFKPAPVLMASFRTAAFPPPARCSRHSMCGGLVGRTALLFWFSLSLRQRKCSWTSGVGPSRWSCPYLSGRGSLIAWALKSVPACPVGQRLFPGPFLLIVSLGLQGLPPFRQWLQGFIQQGREWRRTLLLHSAALLCKGGLLRALTRPPVLSEQGSQVCAKSRVCSSQGALTLPAPEALWALHNLLLFYVYKKHIGTIIFLRWKMKLCIKVRQFLSRR